MGPTNMRSRGYVHPLRCDLPAVGPSYEEIIMTRYWKRALSLASSLGALTLGVAQAHEPGAPETQRWTGAEEPYHLSEPHIERDRGVAYVSGGIGIERRGRI